jgi:hypothetical protein
MLHAITNCYANAIIPQVIKSLEAAADAGTPPSARSSEEKRVTAVLGLFGGFIGGITPGARVQVRPGWW